MKKICCPNCQVINLEGFVTYPNCAGCGSPLPQMADEHIPFWRRPIGPLVWAPVLGVASIGLALLAMHTFDRPEEPVPVIVMLGDAPAQVRAGDEFVLSLHVDAVDKSNANDERPLHNMRLRLPRELFRRFAVVSIVPLPDRVIDLGRGRYLQYSALPRGTDLSLRLRALRPGPQWFSAVIHDENLTAFGYRKLILVGPVTH